MVVKHPVFKSLFKKHLNPHISFCHAFPILDRIKVLPGDRLSNYGEAGESVRFSEPIYIPFPGVVCDLGVHNGYRQTSAILYIGFDAVEGFPGHV